MLVTAVPRDGLQVCRESAFLSHVRLRASWGGEPGLALVELSVVEQRYRAVLDAAAGVPVTEVAEKVWRVAAERACVGPPL